MKTDAILSRNYKDSFFRFLFGNNDRKAFTLQLYNSVNDSDYTDTSLIEFNTMEGVVFAAIRNDVSFYLLDEVSVYEHQSTFSPNIPLRMLQYVSALYAGYIAVNKLNKYSSRQIKLPIPRLVVFYNGTQDVEDDIELKLMSAFPEGRERASDINVTVRLLNVNFGHNPELMKRCKPLYEYSWFVDRIRTGINSGMTQPEAVDETIEEMPDDFVIRPTLIRHRAEVESMYIIGDTEEQKLEMFIEEAKQEGEEIGRRKERANTEREREEKEHEREAKEHERKRADNAEVRADNLETELEKYKAFFGPIPQ